jgi:hypothetical protein
MGGSRKFVVALGALALAGLCALVLLLRPLAPRR